MRRFLARRVAHGAAVIFIAASLSFLLVHLAPGDPFSATLESTAISDATRARWRAAYGLDRSIPEQYVAFLRQVAVGNLGVSVVSGKDATAVIGDALPRTLLLMGTALILSFLGGVTLGAWQAARHGSRADRAASVSSLVVASVPEFWLALALLVLFSYKLRVLPGGGVTTPVIYDFLSLGGQLVDRLRHLILPALTLGLLGMASIARYQRAALIDVLPRDFVRTARAKGVSETRVVWHHALRNALIPTIVLVGLSLPTLLGGAVFVERIFSWNGMGYLAANAFGARDYQIVVAVTMVGAVLVVVGGILTDVLHAAIDPRVRVR